MTRKQTITSLLEFNSNLDKIREQLSRFDWDSEEQIEGLARHVRRVLEQYIAKERTADELEDWANLIECRDDVVFPDKVNEVIFELANPTLTQPLSEKRAADLIRSIDAY